jgi:hypothetical protein
MIAENDKISHQIVTRPYTPERYAGANGKPLSIKPLTEIEVKKADILGKIENFSVNIKTTPTSLIKTLMDSYKERFGDSIEKPNIFLHLIQNKSSEPLAPRLQIYVSDVSLGHLNIDGFYRTVVDGGDIDFKKTRKYLKDILGLYWSGVVDIKGAYFGYRVDIKR